MINRLEQIVKGIVWGLMIVILIHTCSSCASQKKLEDIQLTDVNSANISESNDSMLFNQINTIIKNQLLNIKTNQYSKAIYYSEPSETGEQYITEIKHSQTLQNVSSEQQEGQLIVTEYKRLQRVVDSLRYRLNKIETFKKETTKTSGGVFSWTSTEVANILALILLVIIAWIYIKTRGFI